MIDNRMTIFVATPDSYSDVFDIYLQCYRKYCSDSPYELVVATNTKTYGSITCIPNGKKNDTWEERSIPVLKNLNTKYVLTMDDDFFIIGRIDYTEIENILNSMDKYNISFCGLTNHLPGKPIEENSSLVWVKKNQAYAKNLQVGIFNREYLIDLLENSSNDAHAQEAKWIEEAFMAPEGEYFSDIVSCKNNVIPCVHGVAMGKWFPNAIKAVKRQGIKVCSSREYLSRQEEFKIILIKKFGKKFSPKNRTRIKNMLRKIGFEFITNH